MQSRAFLRLALGAFFCPWAASLSHAQLGTRPMTLVVPYPPGGPLDTAARVLAEQIGPALGTTVVVDNRPGAGGNLGAAAVSRAQPDGQTLVMGAVATHAINPWLYASMPYDALKDFTPLTLVARVPNVLVMNASRAKSLGIENTKGLIEYVRRNPGKLNYASGGNGSAGHLAGEMFKSLAKASMVHIPYNGAAPAQAGLLAGQTDLMFDNLASATQNIRAGRLVAFGVTTVGRSQSLPDIPPINDVLPGFHISTWFGIFGPANMPPALVEQLSKAFVTALNSSDTKEKFGRMSAIPAPMTPSEFAAFVKKEHSDYGRLIRASGIKVE